MVLTGGLGWAGFAQQAPLQQSDHAIISATIQGTVMDAAGNPVADVSVVLIQKDHPGDVKTKTNASGAFVFSALRAGTYQLSSEKSGLRSAAQTLIVSEGAQQHVNVRLEASGAIQSNSPETMEFADKPNFTVAGVTDWTAVGGHGSDSILRTSEDLARETLTLKPEVSGNRVAGLPGGASAVSESESKLRAALAGAPGSFETNHQLGEFYLHAGRYRESIPLLQAAFQIDPANAGNAYDLALAYKQNGDLSQAREHVQKLLALKDTADLHRLLGELDEKLGDPLAAVHEYEQAVRLDPSEQNYFEWASELLLHRAVWQAVEVFGNGTKAYPKSARMLAALGTALFAGARYDEAALRLCDASDLNPADLEPYIFLGRIQMAAPTPLACVEPRLARFVQEQPGNSLANYFYAMAIWKRQEQPADQRALQQVEALLTKAVTIDRNCSDAYLQLGVVYFSQHNFEKAIRFYTKAIEANPQLGEAHYRLGVAYDRIGEPAKAKQEFQLHDEIEKQQAAAIEQQRREVKQFLVVLQRQPTHPLAN
ncbi:MAG TPA: tetratricopeptide repeat protein [Silvibacterium sp.]|nr:tetratricopeptide repeat protein [Silvibacterium sp.]